jgi:hypothetical protein
MALPGWSEPRAEPREANYGGDGEGDDPEPEPTDCASSPRGRISPSEQAEQNRSGKNNTGARVGNRGSFQPP